MAANILVPIDFSDATEAVLRVAGRLAKALGAKLWLIHVGMSGPDFVGFEVGPLSVRDDLAEELRQHHKILQERAEQLRREGLDATAMLVPGAAADKIVEEALRLNADLIVLGSHGHGALYRLLAGSVCTGVLKEAPCPVVVVPARPAETKE